MWRLEPVFRCGLTARVNQERVRSARTWMSTVVVRFLPECQRVREAVTTHRSRYAIRLVWLCCRQWTHIDQRLAMCEFCFCEFLQISRDCL